MALGKEKVFSIGEIVIQAKGDIYLIYKFKKSDLYLSRHASGKTHWKANKQKFYNKIREGMPTKNFKGIELLSTQSFGMNNLPDSFDEYVKKRSDGIFCVDMRQYKNNDTPFNMLVYMLTKEGLSSLLAFSRLLENTQICLFPNCNPMISIIVGKAKLSDAKT